MAKQEAKKVAAAKSASAKAPRKKAPGKKAPPKRVTVGPIVTGTAAGAASATSLAGSVEAYRAQLPPAQDAAGPNPPPFHLKPALALQNVQTSLAALAPHTATLSKLPAPFQLDAMQAVLQIALATVYAGAHVDAPSPGTTAALVKQATAIRSLLLSALTTLVKAGSVPASVLAAITKGRGPAHIAQGCVDLADAFTTNAAAIANKTPVTAAQVAEAQAVGDQLLLILKPKGTKEASRDALPTVAARNALGFYLTQQYEQQVRRAGMWIWGDQVDQHVPPLGSHVVKKKAKATKPAPPTPPAA